MSRNELEGVAKLETIPLLLEGVAKRCGRCCQVAEGVVKAKRKVLPKGRASVTQVQTRVTAVVAKLWNVLRNEVEGAAKKEDAQLQKRVTVLDQSPSSWNVSRNEVEGVDKKRTSKAKTGDSVASTFFNLGRR